MALEQVRDHAEDVEKVEGDHRLCLSGCWGTLQTAITEIPSVEQMGTSRRAKLMHNEYGHFPNDYGEVSHDSGDCAYDYGDFPTITVTRNSTVIVHDYGDFGHD